MCVKNVINDISGLIYEANNTYLIGDIKEQFQLSDEPIIYYYIIRNNDSNNGYWMHSDYGYDKNNYIYSYFKTLADYREDRINKILE